MQYPNAVTDRELVVRYVVDKSSYRPSDNTLKHSLFMPAPDNELSVYRISELVFDEIIDLGVKFVSNPRNKKLLGYASLQAEHIIRQDLRFEPTNEPNPRHANVIGWSEKAANILKAARLAENATLTLAKNGSG